MLPRINIGVMYSSGGFFSEKELQKLVESPITCVCVEKRVRHIALLPHSLTDLMSAIRATLISYQDNFDVR